MSNFTFPSGRLLMTRGIASLLETEARATLVVRECLRRHLAGDCGDMGTEDVAANAEAIASGSLRVFSAYETAHGRLWVITEADRSATTVLFPRNTDRSWLPAAPPAGSKELSVSTGLASVKKSNCRSGSPRRHDWRQRNSCRRGNHPLGDH